MATDRRQELIGLYQKMHELTEPVCAHGCRVPRSCCDAFACEIAVEYAAERWGVALPLPVTPNTR